VLESNRTDDAGYWISSFSGEANCVAVARLDSGGYAIRHSRHDDPPIAFTADEWKAFLAGVKAGEFDF